MNITARILELDQKHFPRPWTREQWEELNPLHHLLIPWANEGFALFMRVPGDETAHLLKICLAPEKRGSGESQKFWEHILKELRALDVQDIYLEVESDNERAIGFYQKCGFQRLRLVKGYYSDGRDGIMMSLELK